VLDDTALDRATACFPPPDVTPAEFERFVITLFAGLPVTVTLGEKVAGVDGVYEFDATVRHTLAGLDLLILVEAKRHRNPIRRDTVQILRQKVISVGGHKGVIISTAPYQRGAVQFAHRHGIALVTVTEERFVFATRTDNPAITDGLIAHLHRDDGTIDALSPRTPALTAQRLLGLPPGIERNR
jgi:hypothetical protein